MEETKKNVKAIGLLSGGLDSILAIRVLVDQGVDVLAVHFISPFFSADKRGREAEIEKYYADVFGIQARVVDVSGEYMSMLARPRYGYGKNFNPCIDCKIFLFKKALEIMREEGAGFLVTGEVIGQRPMSQRRDTMSLIARDLGAREILLRPLSAKIMDPTIPELEGWVDREKLYGFAGRSRKPQMRLAARMGIADYPTPAGGCRLTDPIQAARVKKYFDGTPFERISSEDVRLLLIGRPFVLPGGSILTVGRTEEENLSIEKLRMPGDQFLLVIDIPGPVGLLRSPPEADDSELAAAIVHFYCPKAGQTAKVGVGPEPESVLRVIETQRPEPAYVDKWRS